MSKHFSKTGSKTMENLTSITPSSTPSLQKQLLIWVLGCVLSIGLLVQAIVFWYSYQKFSEAQDNNLSYLAKLVSSRSTFRPPISKDNNTTDSRDSRNNPPNPPPDFEPNTKPTFSPAESPNPAISPPIQPSNPLQDNALDGNDDSSVLQYQGIKDGIQVDIIPVKLKNFDSDRPQPAVYNQLLTLPTGFSEVKLADKTWKVFRKDTPRRIIIVRQPIDWQKRATLQSAWQSILPILLSVLILLFILPLILSKILRPVELLAKQMANRDELDLSQITMPTNRKNQSILPSELLPLVNSINDLLQRIDGYLQGQKRFIANVAHELRSPLTAISLQVQNLQKFIQNDTRFADPNWQYKLRQNVDKLVVRVENNQHLVEQLLTFARIDAKQSALLRSANPIPVMLTLTEAVTLLFPIADNKDIYLEIDNRLGNAVDTPDYFINLDETSLLVLLKNLIQNAILYTPNTGNVTVVISNSADTALTHPSDGTTAVAILRHSEQQEPHSRLLVQIKDTGIGIEPEQYQRVFEPFVRLGETGENRTNDTVKKTLSTTGSGLGLSIVYQICEQAGIDLYLSATTSPTDGNENSGLTVTLVFGSVRQIA